MYHENYTVFRENMIFAFLNLEGSDYVSQNVDFGKLFYHNYGNDHIYKERKTFFLNEQKSRDAAAKKYRYKRSRDK